MRKVIMTDSGHSSLSVLALILLIGVLFFMAASILRQEREEWLSMSGEWENRILKESILRQILAGLEEDPTPQSHSPIDPVWDYIASCQTGEIRVELRDISSRLNPNFMNIRLFEKSDLKRLIIDGTPSDLMRKTMEKRTFHAKLTDWTGIFGEENLNRFFTIHSWANINTDSEESLEILYRIRAGDGGAASFRSRVQEGRREGKLWKTEELNQILGTRAGILYPAINCLPSMNIHFMEPLLLEALLSYPFGEHSLDNPDLLASTLLSERKSGEIYPSELKTLLNPSNDQLRILEYLGTRTWFWELNVSIKEKTYHSVIGSHGEGWFVVE